ncbi:MAG: nuclear transport factor 2 family protein [Saprospiraceae bacterium]|nr:nuclear transport factor 2 family protein [Saprospiraceae bacterium]
MKKIVLFLTLLGLPLVNIAQAGAAEEARVLQLHFDKFRWMATEQLDSLGSILDKRVRYIHSNGWVESREEVLENLRSDKLGYRAVIVEEAQARAYGNRSVVVVGKGNFQVTMEGKPLEFKLLYTEVYVRHKKSWKLVSRHACKLQ